MTAGICALRLAFYLSNGEWNIMEKFLDSTVDTTALAGTGLVTEEY